MNKKNLTIENSPLNTDTNNNIKIKIEGISEVFGDADLQLKAILQMLDFDFKFLEETVFLLAVSII